MTIAELDFSAGPDFFTPFTPADSTDIIDPIRRTTLPVSIGGREFVLDLKQYVRRSMDVFRQAQDPSKEPGEQSLSIEGIWKRTQFGWQHGTGQEFADDETSDRLRFWDSEGVDVWTRRQITLLNTTQNVHSGTHTLILAAGQYVYVWDGSVLWAAQVTNTTNYDAPSWVDQTDSGGVRSMCTDGDKVYVAQAGGVRQFTVGTPGQTDFCTTIAPDKVWFANGWLLASEGAELHTVSPSGTAALVHTHHSTGFKWVSAVSTPGAIYVMGTNSVGTKTEIYRTTVKDDGSALNVPIFSGDLPDGEKGVALGYYQNTVLIGTDQGFRLAIPGSNGELSIGPLVDIGQVNGFAPWGKFVWLAGPDGLWRIDLAVETDTLVPPYATDLRPTDTPVSCLGVVMTSIGEPYFLNGEVWGKQLDTYVDSGWLQSGWWGMASPERKVVSSGSLRAEPLPGDGTNNCQIDLSIEDDASTIIVIGSLTEPGTRDPGYDWDGQSLDSELIRTKVTLYSSSEDHTETPTVRRATIRIIPAPQAVDEIIAPIVIGDTVQRKGGGPSIAYDTFDTFHFLKSLEDSRQVINYREGQVTYRATIRAVAIEGPEGWAREDRFFNTVVKVRLVTELGVPPTIGD